MRHLINPCGTLPYTVVAATAILLGSSSTANAQFHIYNGAGVGYDHSVPGYGGLYGYPPMGITYGGMGSGYPSFNSSSITVSYSYPGYALPAFSYSFPGWGYSYPAAQFAYPGWGYGYFASGYGFSGAYSYPAYGYGYGYIRAYSP
jgi:hypothetical protein